MTEAIETFTADIIRRSKDVETLISALPSNGDSGARVSSARASLILANIQATRIGELLAELEVENKEYKDALSQAGRSEPHDPQAHRAEALMTELDNALGSVLGYTPEHDDETSETSE